MVEQPSEPWSGYYWAENKGALPRPYRLYTKVENQDGIKEIPLWFLCHQVVVQQKVGQVIAMVRADVLTDKTIYDAWGAENKVL